MNIRENVAAVIAGVSGGEPTDDALQALDSLDLVELVVRLEEELSVEIPDTMLSDTVFASIDSLVDLMEEVCAGAGEGQAVVAHEG